MARVPLPGVPVVRTDQEGRHASGPHVTAVVAADAALVLSELVTHSGDERPDLLPVEPNRIGGLGLHVVGRVAGDWGVAPFPGGKTVWATLLQPDR